VSSSDADASKGVCQGVAVFTRVYPFVFWIRDIIEGINGEAGRDLNQNVPYPYSVSGNEIQLKLYQGLPKEWENRITSLTLRYAYATQGELLTSLESAQTLNSIKFQNVVLKMEETKKRLVLPLLTEFYLDLLRPDFKLGESRTFPQHLTESRIKSYIFFNKDYGNRDLSLSELLDLKVDIDLVVHIFRLIHINEKRGEIFLNQVSADALFRAAQHSEISLKKLALHRTRLDVSVISRSRSLTSLILSRVKLVGNFEFDFLPELKHLVMDPIIPQSDQLTHFTIGLDKLPASLESITLSNTVYLIEQDVQNIINFRRIFFHQMSDTNATISEEMKVFPHLKRFCCEFCHMDTRIYTNFHSHFPNLSTLTLRTNETVELDSILSIPNLKSIFLEGEVTNLGNFVGLDKILKSRAPIPATVHLKRLKNNWVRFASSQADSDRGKFECNGGNYFWTSEEDYRSKLRLKSFEREAVATKKYVFNGTRFAQAESRRATFDGIPAELQQELTSVVLSGVDVTPRILSSSIEKAPSLKSLSLLDSYVIGNGERYTFTTENLTFVLDSVQFQGLNFEYVYEIVNGDLVAGVVPFQHVGKFNTTTAANPLSRLFKNVSSARLEGHLVTLYSLDSTVGEIGSAATHIRRLMASLPDWHPLKPMLQPLEDMKASFEERIFPPELKIPGLHVVNQNNMKTFFSDPLVKVMGRAGLLRYFLKRHGNYLHLISLSVNSTRTVFPPIQGIALSIVRGSYLKTKS